MSTATLTHADDLQLKGSARSRWRIWIFFAIYALIAVIGYWHAWTNGPSGYVLSPGGDQAVSMWYLTWTPYSLLHGLNPLFSNVGNYPFGVNTMVNGQPLPLDYLMMPVTLTAGPAVSFNLLGTLSPLAAAATSFFFIRRFVRWDVAAFVGGLLYGFSPYVVGQGIGHLFIEFVALPPLILLVAHDVIVRQPGRAWARGVLLGALIVLQFLISTEVLLGTAVMAAAGTILLAVLERSRVRQHLRYVATALASAAALAVVALAYPIWMMFKGPGHIVGAIQTAPQAYRADLLGPVLPDTLQLISPSFATHVSSGFAGNGSENGSYLGIPLILVLVVGTVWLWRNRVVMVAAVLAVVAFVMSLGSRLVVDNHVTPIRLPEGVFDKLPLFKNAIPVRYSLYVSLFAAMVLASVVEELHRRAVRHRWGTASAVGPLLVGAVALVPLIPAWPYQMVPVTTPKYFTTGADDAITPGSVVAIYPFPDALFADPQLWQATTFLRFKMPGGRFNTPLPGDNTYSASRPSATDTVFSEIFSGQLPPQSSSVQDEVVSELRSWHVGTVVAVPAGPNPQAAITYLTWMLGAPPKLVDDVFVWYHWH